MVSSRPSSRVSSVTPSPTPSTPSARPSPPSTLSTLSSARAVPSTVSVVKCFDHEAPYFWLGDVYDDRENNKRAIDYYNIGMKLWANFCVAIQVLIQPHKGMAFFGAHGYTYAGPLLTVGFGGGRCFSRGKGNGTTTSLMMKHTKRDGWYPRGRSVVTVRCAASSFHSSV